MHAVKGNHMPAQKRSAMIGFRLTASIFYASTLVPMNGAYAQNASSSGFEGYVFEAKSRRPLENAQVTYAFTTTGGLPGSSTVSTNESGFYQIERGLPNQQIAVVGLTAVCPNRRGTVMASETVYTDLRTKVYRRDFYITLPRGITKCSP